MGNILPRREFFRTCQMREEEARVLENAAERNGLRTSAMAAGAAPIPVWPQPGLPVCRQVLCARRLEMGPLERRDLPRLVS